MSPARYVSYAHRKASAKRREAELRRDVEQAKKDGQPKLPEPVEQTYADGLLPTLPGFVHGVVGLDPLRVQCDGCGKVVDVGIRSQDRPVFTRRFDDPRCLCPACRPEGWSRS